MKRGSKAFLRGIIIFTLGILVIAVGASLPMPVTFWQAFRSFSIGLILILANIYWAGANPTKADYLAITVYVLSFPMYIYLLRNSTEYAKMLGYALLGIIVSIFVYDGVQKIYIKRQSDRAAGLKERERK